ncbi:hypothetical protein F5888DRAFT_515984 [Russula emetica]|nr:hypothetical protein F5888DRAFT_515984 [Russula emetica]
MRPERSPPLSGEHDSRRPNSSHSPTEVSHVHDGSVSCRSRSHARVKGKGKRRASARSLSPPESDISCRSPVARHERTGSPEVLVTPNLSLFENTPERNAAVSCAPTGDARGEASLPMPQTPENDSGGTPVVSPRLPDGNRNPSIACATHTTNDRLSPLNGPRSLNDEIIASSSSKSETPNLTINTNRARANPRRQPRYRSQRDTIIAHLRDSVATPRRSTQSLLSRMTDQTVAELSVSGDDDADVAKRTVGTPGGEGHVHLASSIRTAERSSGLSDSDDPPGASKREALEARAVTKVGAHLIQSVQEGPMLLSGPPTQPCSIITSSHAHLLDRLYDDDDEKKATTTEARLRTQVRLRARLAAERRLVHDNVNDDDDDCGASSQ